MDPNTPANKPTPISIPKNNKPIPVSPSDDLMRRPLDDSGTYKEYHSIRSRYEQQLVSNLVMNIREWDDDYLLSRIVEFSETIYRFSCTWDKLNNDDKNRLYFWNKRLDVFMEELHRRIMSND